MNLFDCILAFVAIVEQTSVLRAAKTLHQTSAAISKKLSRLETHLGVSLFERQHKILTLTAIGQLYYQQCQKIIGEMSVAEQMIQQTKREPCGELRITSNRYFADSLVLPKLAGFVKKYPKIKLNFNLAERIPDFNEIDTDILFGVSWVTKDNLGRKKIADTKYVLCASPTYLKSFGVPNTPQDLSKHAYIAHNQRRPKDVVYLDNETAHLNVVLSCNDTHAMRQAAIEGIGIVWLHNYVVKAAIAAGQLHAILQKYTQEQLNVYLYYAYARHLDPKIRCFINYFS